MGHCKAMDDNTPDEVFAEVKTRHIGALGVAQIAAGTGLAVYAMWVGVLQPGFRKVPLRLQVPYIPASKAQVGNVMTLLKGRKGGLVDLGSGDGRIEKLQAELPGDALVVAGRFPFPDWIPCGIEGLGVDRAWSYSVKSQKQQTYKQSDNVTVTSDLGKELIKKKESN